jgi:predicted phosphodiesterase
MGNKSFRLNPEEAQMLRDYRTEQMERQLNSISQKLSDKFQPKSLADILELRDIDDITLPKMHDESAAPVVIQGNRIGIINDLHVPVCDTIATAAALKKLKLLNIDVLVINGDFLDNTNLTRHGKDSRTYLYRKEIEWANETLDAIAQYLPGVKIHYVAGNHDEWVSRFARNNGFANLDGVFTVPGLLNLEQRGIDYHDNGMGVEWGKLTIIHGHEIKRGGKYVAANKLAYAKKSIAFGHHHIRQTWTEHDLQRKTNAAYAIGCLCGRTPEWNRYNTYNQGFFFAEGDSEGNFEATNYLIESGKIYT